MSRASALIAAVVLVGLALVGAVPGAQGVESSTADWSTPRRIAGHGAQGGLWASDASIVWSASNSPASPTDTELVNMQIVYAARPLGDGRWAKETLAPHAHEVAVSRDGKVVAWIEWHYIFSYEGDTDAIRVWLRRLVAGHWQPAQDLTGWRPVSSSDDLRIDDTGSTVAWMEDDASGDGIRAMTVRAGKTVGPPVVLAARPYAGSDLALSGNGTTALVVMGHELLAVHRSGSTWSAPVTLAQDALTPLLSADGQVAAWEAGSLSVSRYRAGSWSVPVTVDDAGPRRLLQLSRTGSTLAWAAITTGPEGRDTSIIWEARVSTVKGDSWRAPVAVSGSLSDDGDPAGLLLSSNGTTLAWNELDPARRSGVARLDGGLWTATIGFDGVPWTTGALSADGSAMLGVLAHSESVYEDKPAGIGVRRLVGSHWGKPTRLGTAKAVLLELPFAMSPSGRIAAWEVWPAVLATARRT